MDGFIGRSEHCTNAYADAHCKQGLSSPTVDPRCRRFPTLYPLCAGKKRDT